MNKQKALEAMWKNARAIVAPEFANEIRSAWELPPIKGVKAGTFRGFVYDPDAPAVSMSAVALAITRKLKYPEFSIRCKGLGPPLSGMSMVAVSR